MNLQQLANTSGSNGVHPDAIKAVLNGQQYRGGQPPAYNNIVPNPSQNNNKAPNPNQNNNKAGNQERNGGERKRRDSSGSLDGRRPDNSRDPAKKDAHHDDKRKGEKKSGICTVL